MIAFKRAFEAAALATAALAITAHAAPADEEVGDATQILVSSNIKSTSSPLTRDISVEIDKAAFRADIDRYVRSVNDEIRATLADALKPARLAPEIRLADDGAPRTRG